GGREGRAAFARFRRKIRRLSRAPRRFRGLMMRVAVAALLAFAALLAPVGAAELATSIGGRADRHTTESLLAHPAVTTINVPSDVSYKRAMSYRAVPMSAL